jgi:hypothetical protein
MLAPGWANPREMCFENVLGCFVALRAPKAIKERVATERDFEQSLLGDAEMRVSTGDRDGRVHSSPDRLN